jgi:hypothetical protein
VAFVPIHGHSEARRVTAKLGATTLLCRNAYRHGRRQVLTLETLQFVCKHRENCNSVRLTAWPAVSAGLKRGRDPASVITSRKNLIYMFKTHAALGTKILKCD